MVNHFDPGMALDSESLNCQKERNGKERSVNTNPLGYDNTNGALRICVPTLTSDSVFPPSESL